MENLISQIDSTLLDILHEERVRDVHHSSQNFVYEVIEKFVLGKGKRLRPLSILAFYKAAGGRMEQDNKYPKHILRIAACMELVHDATLAFDDFMDEDEYRRNSKTIVKTFFDDFKTSNKTSQTATFLFETDCANYATSLAILAGNILYSIALRVCQEVSSDVLVKVMDLFIGLNYGQIIDLNNITTLEDYNLNILFKTAIFFKTIASIGLTLAGRGNESIELGNVWGEHFGLAFQMRDDLLDIDAHDKQRSVGSDLREGRKTIIVWTALEDGILESSDKTFVKEMIKLQSKALNDEVKFARLINILQGTPAMKVKERILEHHKLATEALQKLDLEQEMYEFIQKMTDLVLN
ncbi:geranyl geranyl pyrophosphate synthase, putative [Entamoeba invadens IP1]|uniref:Geranyl geranyl pyrophosphate synthase, putative n=1 Tax=Entamoeba invadens IP1 TaxID=370355 RepID=A0A0A1UBN0_ENTIV|nr:geranyl geranyl pyrophosphate synthase, putative [Entamoeba invadens IP1]ELP91082.1 geranyl geranyl pyrophosphate synthase, putative [Entamoeba invadens IP1]|eukprot:XP_004257853.1 geranyl geranyl pyrophosphate synthase, putative [Entamoeba invadens IP1]